MIAAAEREVLRDLARRVGDAAALPVMEERRALWRRHNALQPARPLLLVFPEGAWRELLPESALRTAAPAARAMEGELRRRLFTHEHFRDDTVIEKDWVVEKAVTSTGWGLEPRHAYSSAPTGAWGFDPVLKEPGDLKRLHFPEVRHDERESARRLVEAQEVFGDILDVRLAGIRHVSFHLMDLFTKRRGLHETLEDLVENPGFVHEAMAFFTEGSLRLVRQYEALNLLSPNHDGTYQSSGGVGYLDGPPASGADPARVKPRDLWASAESQEMALVSPAMHETFVMRYERRLLEPFGLAGYGCCEALDAKLDRVLAFPRMRRVSISPFANVARCAAALGDRAILSWKPSPSHLVGAFNPGLVRSCLREGLAAARGCVVEIILKDTHTCEGHGERFTRWTEIAREEINVAESAAGR